MTVLRNGISVTVKLPSARKVVSYGKSFFVSWTGRLNSPPSTLRVTFKSILIRQADPNPALPDPSGAHWALYLDVNGYWQLLNKWAPRLTDHVTDGERIAINHTLTIHVPHGSGIWLQMQGLECDEPAGKTLLGVYANLLYPCPANTDEQNPNILDLFGNDDTGIVLQTYHSAAAAVGVHTASSSAFVDFPGSGRQTFGNRIPGQGDGAYELTYTVSRLPTHTSSHHAAREVPAFAARGHVPRPGSR